MVTDGLDPIAPLTSPISTHKFDKSITRAPTARQIIASRPEASSGEAVAAFGPVWTALIVAIGWTQVCSLETLYSTTASVVGENWQMMIHLIPELVFSPLDVASLPL